MKIDGACHCGLISFTAEIDPRHVVVCHCTDCQVLSGSAFRVSVVAPAGSVSIQGSPRRYVKTAESGARRAQLFCPECATPLFTMAQEGGPSITIRLGCVTQRSELVPAAQIWQRSSLPWLSGLAHIPGSPEQQAKPAL
ncbi:MAG: GFA family protein [Proteobacteria bacterium]|nr:GFA family protein [Pseudomonadota bacterium]